jgi:phage recombination protein Bet
MKLWSDKTRLSEIKSLYAPKASDLEFRAFVEMGKATALNPFLREIWLVKYSPTDPAQIFIGRDGYRKLLSRTQGYEGHIVDAVYSNDEFHVDLINGHVKHLPNLKDRGRLLGAYCIAYMKGLRIPAYTFVDLSEYDLQRSLWKTHKATMIKKVAEAQTTRMAVQVCSGTYSPDEMPEHLLRDSSNKADDLNRNYNLYEGQTIDQNTGEIQPSLDHHIAEKQPEPAAPEIPQAPQTDCPYTFDELKASMLKATNIQDLNDLAAVISHLTISKEQRDELAKIYKDKMKELKKSE